MGESSATVAVRKISEYKETGNELFRAGEFSKALFQYHCAYLYIQEIKKTGENKMVSMIRSGVADEPTEEEAQILKESSLSIFNNMSAVYVKQEKHKKAVEFATKALEIEPNNVKALFRRGKSYVAINEVEAAQQDLDKAYELTDSTDNAIKKELQRLKNKRTQLDKQQQQFYSKCLGN